MCLHSVVQSAPVWLRRRRPAIVGLPRVSWTGWERLYVPSAAEFCLPPVQPLHRPLDPAEGEILHPEDLADPLHRGPAVGLGPVLFGDGIEPDGVAEAVSQAFEAADAGLGVLISPGDGAAGIEELFGGHGGVAQDQQSCLGRALEELFE